MPFGSRETHAEVFRSLELFPYSWGPPGRLDRRSRRWVRRPATYRPDSRLRGQGRDPAQSWV